MAYKSDFYGSEDVRSGQQLLHLKICRWIVKSTLVTEVHSLSQSHALNAVLRIDFQLALYHFRVDTSLFDHFPNDLQASYKGI